MSGYILHALQRNLIFGAGCYPEPTGQCVLGVRSGLVSGPSSIFGMLGKPGTPQHTSCYSVQVSITFVRGFNLYTN